MLEGFRESLIHKCMSEQEERISESSDLAEWPVEFKWEKMLDMTRLDDSLPAIGEIPTCSDIKVLSISIVLRGTSVFFVIDNI